MPSFNRVFLIGRLTKEPELKYTANGMAVTTFTLAVDRKYKDKDGNKQTDFLRCKAWRQKAEFISSYVPKGRLVAVEGSIETSESTGPDGQKRYFTDIICDNIEILESNRDGQAGTDDGRTPDDAPPPRREAMPAPRPEPSYPAEDFDDSDPFADGE